MPSMRASDVIATHGNADFDALASLVAARRLYPGAVAALPGALNRNVRDFARLHADELALVEQTRLEPDAIERLIVVETTTASRLGELEPVALDPSVEKVVFDHHADGLPAWARAEECAVLSPDGALTTTLVGILAEREIEPTPLEATLFALGIHEDTGSLTFASATRRDADALAWCLRHGARQDLIARYLRATLTEDERDLLAALQESLETLDAAGFPVHVAAARWPAYVDGVANLAHKLVDLNEARALVCLVEMEGRTFVVVRSAAPELDAAAVAHALGGGGHTTAASAIVRAALPEALESVRAALPGAVREVRRARDVMSAPVRSVSPDETVAGAMVACQRHAQSGILVIEKGRLVGSVAREDLDKAIGHGLAHAPVKGIMSSTVATCDEQAPLPELQRLVATAVAGRVAVVRDGKVVGVVARRDLLDALGEGAAAEEAPADLRDELAALPRLRHAFDAVAAASDAYDGVYLVGGAVRDVLLGEPNLDVDVAVEGDAIALARAIARQLHGRVHQHEKFGTAVVLYGDDERIDVVTARTEFYDAPAALPSVEHGTIRDDLFRRDFTINAMAVSLKGGDFGRLVDPFAGRRDLEARVLRVLHNLSFIDDPTRIFRAIRYENRLGFRMEERTLRLARGCIEMGLVGDLSSARLRDELVALLQEGEIEHSLLRLGELGADRAVHPRLAADSEAVELLRRLRSLRDRYAPDVPDWRLGLAVLARRLEPDEALGWLERLRVRRRDADLIAAAVVVGPRLADRLRCERLDPAELVALADPYAPDAPLFALALGDAEALHAYFQSLREVRLEVTGRDLARLGLQESPRVGEVLAELRRRKLNGTLGGREAELAAARDLIEAGR